MCATTEATMNAARAVSTSGYLSFRGYRTWYETTGDLRSGVPLVLLHGGPGIPGGSSRWTVLEHSSHLTFMEEPDRYREMLTSFLDDVDAGAPMFPGGPSSRQ